MVQDKILRLKEDIGQICQRLGRDPSGITLVAVTKFASSEKVQEAVASGVTHIGENKVQEAQKKFSSLVPSNTDVTKHMIGHLQANKVKTALEIFDIIQSVDSVKLAREIEKQAQKLNRTVDVLIQVNTSDEEQKHGVFQSFALPTVKEIAGLPHVNIRGLMAIAPLVEDKEIIRRCFRKLRNLRDRIAKEFRDKPNVQMQYLSMGMTHDYEIALEEGANMVRIGRAIFVDES